MPRNRDKKKGKKKGGDGSGNSNQSQQPLQQVKGKSMKLPQEDTNAATATSNETKSKVLPSVKTATSSSDESEPWDSSELESRLRIVKDDIKKFNKLSKQLKQELAESAATASSNEITDKGLTNPVAEKLSETSQTSVVKVPEDPPDLSKIQKQVRLICKEKEPVMKKLEMSDTSKYLNRLALPEKSVNELIVPVMKEEESSKREDGVNIIVYDIKGRKYRMTLKYVSDSKIYVLTGEWWKFYCAFGVKAYEDTAELWAFRHYATNKLCIFIAVSTTNEESEPETELLTVPPEITRIIFTVREGSSDPKELENQIRLLCENEKPMEKQLDKNDMSGNLDTLDLPTEDVNAIILPVLKAKGRPDRKAIDVDVYDQEGRTYHMTLKYHRKSNSYCLTGGWKGFCDNNRMTAYEDFIQLWPFRHCSTQQLCFYIVVEKKKASKHGKKTEQMDKMKRQKGKKQK